MSDESNVIPMRGLIVFGDEPPEGMLEKAKAWKMKRCIVLGEDENGKLVWGASFSDMETANWILDLAKYDIIFRAANE